MIKMIKIINENGLINIKTHKMIKIEYNLNNFIY